MYEEYQVELRMERVISLEGVFNEELYPCRVLRYNAGEDQMQLQLLEGDLRAISLDAIYSCTVLTEEERLSCTGRVKERYRSEKGKILLFRIENGFYSHPAEEEAQK